MPKKRLAKMAAALKACEELNKIGEYIFIKPLYKIHFYFEIN